MLTYRLVTSMSRAQKQMVFAALDALVLALSLILAIALEASVQLSADLLWSMGPVYLAILLVGGGVGWWLGLPQTKLNAYEMRSAIRTAAFAATSALVGLLASRALGSGVGANVFMIFALLVIVLAASWRVLLRQATLEIYRSGEARLRVLIYGAGQTGQQLAAALLQDDKVSPMGFVDYNPTLQSQTISTLRVHAPSNIKPLVEELEIDRIVLAMPSINRSAQARLMHGLRDVGCEVKTLPSFAAMVAEGQPSGPSTPVALEDLLGRNRLEKELPGVSHAYTGRRILVTGAGGSIGSELCRQLVACHPKCVVLVDHSELALYQVHREMRDLDESLQVVPVLGSVLDETLMRETIGDQGIEVVLHAAAYKHVPMVERNALAGLENNVLGTKRLADAAREMGVDRFILVSSDKAVRPTNVMGASKRLAELVIQDLATRSPGTRFSMVRFGNVLGSSGSVIPLFKEQIERGGPVTLTHDAITRYFMTVSEATRLVLLAGSFARGGDVFVLDMGDPVPIRKLAQQMIEGAGYSIKSRDNPGGDIEIKVTGMRPGEKLHEELLISPDMLTTPHAKILRAQEHQLSEFEMATALKDLRLAVEARDEDAARDVINRWVERGSLHEAAQQGR